METPGVYDLSKSMAMAAFQEQAMLKEAEASCELDGETQSCETCPLGKDYRSQIEQETRQECWEDLALEVLQGNFIIPEWDGAVHLKNKWGIIC